ncbi:peptidase S9 prolyl oligopeptidase active site domain protein [Mycena leptocephala]|nr:peptidase S9 prolyl oligopeptidase active site domain protein [Mycena leptocephala]
MSITPQDVANSEQINGLSLSATGNHVVYCVGPSFHAKDAHETQALWLADIGVSESWERSTDLSPFVGSIGGDPEPLTPTKNTRGVSSFEISPNGRWLAYISADEPAEKDEEDKETYVIGRTVVSVDLHVHSFAWSPDSTRILYRLAELPDIESESFPISENIVSIEEDGGDLRFGFTHVMTHNRVLFSKSVWAEPEKFYFLHLPDYASAPALWTCEPAAGTSATRVAFGNTDDAASLVGVVLKLLWRLPDAFSSWDIKQVNSKYIFVVACSSGVTGEIENIWCGSTERGTKGVLSTKLSSHHEWMLAKDMPQCVPFYWSIEDGTALQGVVAFPRGQKPKNLPAVVIPHGGPYGRDTVNMRPSQNYRYFLASHGFLVLSPNYRGSQGRGTEFARAVKGGLGTLDYSDVESMLEAAIKRGYANRRKSRSRAGARAAVIGAGPTDWGSMTITTDIPDIDLGGSAPWSPRPSNRLPSYLRGCPMAFVKNVKVPILVLHGEKDERVPVTQATGFMRGLVREAKKAVGEASTLLIYPREGHGFKNALTSRIS